MDSVNGSLIVVACQAFTCDIIYILVSVSYKLFIIFTICGILFGKINFEKAVILGICIHRTFNHNNRHVRTKLPKRLDEIISQCVAHHLRAVRHRIKHIHVSIFYSRHCSCNALVHFTFSAESQINNLAIEITLNHIGCNHTGSCRTTSLKDTCSIHDYFL